LNRLLCFAIFVGSWKEVGPADAVRLKREADERRRPTPGRHQQHARRPAQARLVGRRDGTTVLDE
ncbi:MAG: hypothetical protein ACRDTE_07495, partial [Pseudonocardiaceae bacterium]